MTQENVIDSVSIVPDPLPRTDHHHYKPHQPTYPPPSPSIHIGRLHFRFFFFLINVSTEDTKTQNCFCITWIAWYSLCFLKKRNKNQFCFQFYFQTEMSCFFFSLKKKKSVPSLINDSRVKVIVKTYEVAVLRYSVFCFVFAFKEKRTKWIWKTHFLKMDLTTDKVVKGTEWGHSFNLKLYCRSLWSHAVRMWASSQSCHEGLKARIEKTSSTERIPCTEMLKVNVSVKTLFYRM